jgi:hypothetical protein
MRSPHTHMSSMPTTTSHVSLDGGSEESHKVNSTTVGIIGGGVGAGVVVLGALFFLLRWWGTRKRGTVTRNQPTPAPDQTSMMAHQYRDLIGSQFTDPRSTLGYPEPRHIANHIDPCSVGPGGRERHPEAAYPEWI